MNFEKLATAAVLSVMDNAKLIELSSMYYDGKIKKVFQSGSYVKEHIFFQGKVSLDFDSARSSSLSYTFVSMLCFFLFSHCSHGIFIYSSFQRQLKQWVFCHCFCSVCFIEP